MSWLFLQTVAQTSIERILNAFPAGFLIALFAWALLRVLRKQNSGTRFAVWFLALLTVAAFPLLGGFGEGRSVLGAGMSSAASWGSMRSAITIPARWALFAFFAWAFGAGVALLRLAAGLFRLRKLRRSCTTIDQADLDPAVRETLAIIGASGSVVVATSECVRVPAAIGFWKRTIVLPEWAMQELPPEDLSVILLHEFAHLRRWDDWTNLIQKIVRALLFFHPAVWWIENRLSVEREMACDDAVLAETANPHGYATCLVSLLEKSLAHRRLAGGGWSMAQAAVDRAREASLRLARILDNNRSVGTRVWKPAVGMVGIFSVVCLLTLPHTPQFVAFDQGTQPATFDRAYSDAVSQSASQSLESSSGEPGALARRSTTPPNAVARHQFVPAQAVAARFKAHLWPAQVVQVGANADQQPMPQFQTLVLIEATEYMGADSPVWSVQVWRVTFVNVVNERLVRVPVANSI